MSTCMPIKDMKDTATFTKKIKEAQGPVTITKNGYDAFVVMETADFEAMQLELAKARLLERITKAESEYASNQSEDGSRFTASIEDKYGL